MSKKEKENQREMEREKQKKRNRTKYAAFNLLDFLCSFICEYKAKCSQEIPSYLKTTFGVHYNVKDLRKTKTIVVYFLEFSVQGLIFELEAVMMFNYYLLTTDGHSGS